MPDVSEYPHVVKFLGLFRNVETKCSDRPSALGELNQSARLLMDATE